MSVLLRLIGLLVLAVTVGIGVMVALTGAAAFLTGWWRACKDVARGFHGTCSVGWWGRPKIRIQTPVGQYVLRYCSARSGMAGERTELCVTGMDGVPTRGWVGTFSPTFRFWEGWGMKSVPVVDTSGFPRPPLAYFTSAPDGQAMLTRSALETLRRIQKLAPNGHFELRIRHDAMTIAIPGCLKDAGSIEEFIRRGIELQLQIQLGLTGQDIEFLNSERVSVGVEAVCPVCSSIIKRDPVICRRCRTPHCRECWEYAGACAIYACGEKKYRRVVDDAEVVHHSVV